MKRDGVIGYDWETRGQEKKSKLTEVKSKKKTTMRWVGPEIDEMCMPLSLACQRRRGKGLKV